MMVMSVKQDQGIAPRSALASTSIDLRPSACREQTMAWVITSHDWWVFNISFWQQVFERLLSAASTKHLKVSPPIPRERSMQEKWGCLLTKAPFIHEHAYMQVF